MPRSWTTTRPRATYPFLARSLLSLTSIRCSFVYPFVCMWHFGELCNRCQYVYPSNYVCMFNLCCNLGSPMIYVDMWWDLFRGGAMKINQWGHLYIFSITMGSISTNNHKLVQNSEDFPFFIGVGWHQCSQSSSVPVSTRTGQRRWKERTPLSSWPAPLFKKAFEETKINPLAM